VAPITERALVEQEACFARAFASSNLEIARPLYEPDVIYLSPTVRLFEWPARIEGVDRALEFISLTIRHLRAIEYRAVETAVVSGGSSAFVRIHFDWTNGSDRLRSNYVVIYRYRDHRIARQELYYDPSSPVEVLSRA
jgi:ketosteroid isomerase-like protein